MASSESKIRTSILLTAFLPTTTLLIAASLFPFGPIPLIVWAITMLGSLLASDKISRNAARPITDIRKDCERILAGKFPDDSPNRHNEDLRRIHKTLTVLSQDHHATKQHLESLVANRTATLDQSQQTLRESISCLTAALDASPTATFMCNPEGLLLHANKAFFDLLHKDPDTEKQNTADNIADHFASLFSKEPLARQAWRQMQNKPERSGSWQWPANDKNTPPLQVQALPLHDDQHSKIIARLWTIQKASETRQREQTAPTHNRLHSDQSDLALSAS